MDTPSTDPHSAPRKSWRSLATQAAGAKPPADLDVRHAVRAMIASGAANEMAHQSRNAPGLMEQITLLGQGLFARLALGGCCAAAAATLWAGLDTVAGLRAAIDLQGLFMTTL